MDAIITAGGIPLPGEPLYPYTLGGNKAMLDIAGRPMIQWVVQALSASKNIDHIIISGINQPLSFTCPKPFTVLPNHSDMLDNIRSAVEHICKENPTAQYSLIVASDIPALTTEMVDWMVGQVNQTPADVYYNTVSRTLMETRYPDSHRTYVKLKDTEICGGDMNAINLGIFKNSKPVWQDLINTRKNPLQQARIIGLDLLVRVMLRRITLEDAAALISRRLGIVGKAIVSPYAEIGMDVDKPGQLEIIKKDLGFRKPQ
jgi:GTP:adenosylcobinamide-phosphate guanylyltransferase